MRLIISIHKNNRRDTLKTNNQSYPKDCLKRLCKHYFWLLILKYLTLCLWLWSIWFFARWPWSIWLLLDGFEVSEFFARWYWRSWFLIFIRRVLIIFILIILIIFIIVIIVIIIIIVICIWIIWVFVRRALLFLLILDFYIFCSCFFYLDWQFLFFEESLQLLLGEELDFLFPEDLFDGFDLFELFLDYLFLSLLEDLDSKVIN